MSANRRFFLKLSGLSILPAVLPAGNLFAREKNVDLPFADEPIIKLFGDGEMYEPAAYIELLKQANTQKAIERAR